MLTWDILYKTLQEKSFESILTIYTILLEHVHTDFHIASVKIRHNIVLEYIHSLLSGFINEKNYITFLRRCVLEQVYHPSQNTPREWSDFVRTYRTYDIYKKLDYEETLKKYVEKLPLKVQSMLFYCLLYPQEIESIMKCSLYSSLERALCLCCFFALYGEQSMTGDDLFKTYPKFFPETFLERGLLFASLEKKEPDLCALLLLLRSPVLFVQFFLLFGGKTLMIPSLQEVYATLEEHIEQSETEHMRLDFVKNIVLEEKKEGTFFAKDLAEYMEMLYTLLIRRYEKYLEDTLGNLEHGDAKSLIEAYSFFQQEMQSQMSLVEKSAQYLQHTQFLSDITKVKETLCQ